MMELSERNLAIVEMVMMGSTFIEAGRTHGVTRGRAHQIVSFLCRYLAHPRRLKDGGVAPPQILSGRIQDYLREHKAFFAEQIALLRQASAP